MQIMPATVSSFNAAGAQLELNYHTQPSSIPEDYCMHHHDHGFCNYNSYANPIMDSSFNRAGAHYKPSSCFNSHGGLRRISPIAPCRLSVLNSCLQSPKTPPSPPVHGSSPGPWHGRSSSAHEGNFGSSPNSVLQQVLNSPHECDAILIQPNSMTNISSGMQPPVKKKMKRTPSPSSIASAPCPLGMSGDFCFSGSSPTVWVSLEEAVHAQDENTVADLLIQGYNPNDTTSFGEPLLILAVRSGNENIVNRLLLAQADANCKDNSLCTPLHHAAKGGQRNLVQLLLRNGANIYARNSNGQLPLNVATDLQIHDLLACHMKSYAAAESHFCSSSLVMNQKDINSNGQCPGAEPHICFAPLGMDQMPVNNNIQSPGLCSPFSTNQIAMNSKELSSDFFESRSPSIKHVSQPRVSPSGSAISQTNQVSRVPKSPALMTRPAMSPSSKYKEHYHGNIPGILTENFHQATQQEGQCHDDAYAKFNAFSSSSNSNIDKIRLEYLSLRQRDGHESALNGSAGCQKSRYGDVCLSSSKKEENFINDFGQHAQNFTSMHWTRGELLGHGSHGKVYAGLNQSTGELMAVKEIKVKEISGPEERAMYLASLEREIGLYKTLRHRYIVGYIDMEMDETTGSLYIFLEYVPGGSIQRMLERFGRFSDPVVKVYTRQLLLGLEYLHSNNIIHRDLKGGNVLVDTDGIVKLADFGASKTLPVATVDSKTTDCCNSIRGSVFWMAPEVIKGDGYGRKADIWSVGCTVLEMLTASHPWPEMDNAWAAIFHLAQSNSGPPLPDGIPDVVKDFLGKCFQVNPKERPTATELLRHPFLQMDTA